jgi:hypothetical protein
MHIEASPKAANRLDETILEHSADSGKTFRTLATLKSAHDVAWSSSDAFDIATLRAAANRSEFYVVRLAGRPVNGAGVRICEWWHDVRRAVVTVHADGASGAAYHVDAHVSRTGHRGAALLCRRSSLAGGVGGATAGGACRLWSRRARAKGGRVSPRRRQAARRGAGQSTVVHQVLVLHCASSGIVS